MAVKKLNETIIELKDSKGVYFSVIKEKATGIYFFTLLNDEHEHFELAYYRFRSFMDEWCKGWENIGKLTLENIYDVTSLTSDPTLEGLFHKFRLLKYIG